jgi:uncharacterized membrane protein YfcA
VALATHKIASVALGLGATLRHLKESHLERRFSLIDLGAGLAVSKGNPWIKRAFEIVTILIGLKLILG